MLWNSNLNKTFTVKVFENAIQTDKTVLSASVNIIFKLLQKDNNVTIQIVRFEFNK